MRQTSLDAADCRFACPPFEGFVSGLQRPDFAGRRRSATRLLGRYRDRTFTGKPHKAYLDTPQARHSGMGPWLSSGSGTDTVVRGPRTLW